MNRHITTLFALITLLCSFSSLAGVWSQDSFSDDEVTLAKNQLTRQNFLLEELDKTVKQVDRSRINFLRQHNLKILQHINEYGLSHAKTFTQYQIYIINFRYSQEFFKRIETEIGKSTIAEILVIYSQVSARRGFDDSPYSMITLGVFTQIQKHLLDILDKNIEEGFKAKLRLLKAPTAEVIAAAQAFGDRPSTFDKSRPLISRYMALYGDFAKISHSHEVFNLVFELQGLIEFYAEYGQVASNQN